MRTSFVFNGISALLSITGVAAAPATNGKNDDKACSSGPKPRVSVKQVSNFCETTPGVKSYSGYVMLPPSTNYPFEQNIFFWLFESRSRPKSDPLTVWINGGPGSPSTDQALGSNGPCRVQPDSKTTKLNADSWNNKANLLYIDQPVQTGFSYNNVTPGRLGLIGGFVYPEGTPVPDYETVLFNGSFSTQDPSQTLNTTQSIARVLGGHYVPAIATYFEAQSKLAAAGKLPPNPRICSRAKSIRIATAGIIAPFIDIVGQFADLEFALNNTYGIEIFDPVTVEDLVEQAEAPGGCFDLIDDCRNITNRLDPEGWGNAPEVYPVCNNAFFTCYTLIERRYEATGRDSFDITQPAAAQFPPPYAYGFLNRQNTQSRLGVPVNYTAYSPSIQYPFFATGDFLLSFAPHVERLLAADIPVHLIHGDRDWRANWIGGEAVALALAHRNRARFAAAGYAPLSVPGVPAGKAGHVRQAGRLSFSVVTNAGHEIPYYQPATAYAIYQRAIEGRDVATGKKAIGNGDKYATSGPKDIRGARTPLPAKAPVFCYTASTPIVPGQCTDAQIAALADGTAVVKDFVVVQPAWSG
ncbi:Carboxypeptidase S1 A like protein [Verticillium longisporum]|uniref:Carboxypeptidase S1 A like protein n=1 Tax=Verticillium longisporum TaxID=100787 RepID=A0A8I3AI81_VERLO|nr:Carboxypeptidase S1 A like protein [Verticillium longisporum]